MLRILIDYLKMNTSQRSIYREEKSRIAFRRQIIRLRKQRIY
jgi:hypothetical protein